MWVRQGLLHHGEYNMSTVLQMKHFNKALWNSIDGNFLKCHYVINFLVLSVSWRAYHGWGEREKFEKWDWDHPHSMYTQRGRGGFKPNAYDCVQGDRAEGSRLRTCAKKIFFGPQNIKTFLLLYQRSYFVAIYYCV